MTQEDDLRWAQRVVGETDPLRRSEAGIAALAASVRDEVGRRIAAEEISTTNAGSPGWRRRGRSPWLAAAAAIVALVVAYAGLGAALPDPAWAVEQTADGLVRVEISSVLGKGPPLGDLVEELEAVGIPVVVQRQPTWWPPHAGRVMGVGWESDAVPNAWREGSATTTADLSDIGIIDFGDGPLTLDPELFTGRVQIVVGEPAW